MSDDELVRDLAAWVKQDCDDELAALAQQYPGEKSTFIVDWADLHRHDTQIAEDAVDHTDTVRKWIRRAVTQAAPQQALIDRTEEDGTVVRGEELTIAFTNVADPIDVTEAIRGDRVGELVTLRGTVAKASDTRPKPTVAALECGNCGVVSRVHQPIHGHNTPGVCQSCESSRSDWTPQLKDSDWQYHQLARVKHEPGETQSDAHVDVHLMGDAAGSVSGGESVDVTGVLDDVWPDGIESGEPQFIIKGDAVDKHDNDFESIEVRSFVDRVQTLAAGEEGDPYGLLVECMAPGIHGGETMDKIKLALACQLFGAPRVEKADGTSFRGDIHQLLVGGPGTGKSSLMDAVAAYSPKVSTVSGKNASKAGVTAAAVRDDFGDTEWSIEAGAFVQANKGVCIVDELDKVDPDVVSSLHSALERQRLSIAKAGITADLACETALLGAANPEHERFVDEQKTIEQVPVGPAMRTRLDTIFVLRDQVNKEDDAAKVETMLNSIASGDAVETQGFDDADRIDPPLDREEIQAWVAYARQRHTVTFDMPTLHKRISEYYTDIREQSADTGAPVNLRKVGSILRYALASARIRLGDTVTDEDIDRAIGIVSTSLAQIGMTEDGKFTADAGVAEQVSQASRIERVKQLIDHHDNGDGADVDEVLTDAQNTHDLSPSAVEQEIEKLMDKGRAYEPQTGHIKTT